MNVELTQKVLSLVPLMPGWCTVEKSLTLAALVTGYRPKLVVEIGVYAGRSALPMAMALRSNMYGTLTAIDAWSAGESQKGQTPEHQVWWSKQQMHDDAYDYFQRALESNHVTSYVDVIRKPSDQVDPPQRIGILHVDGNHSEQSVRDVVRFCPNIIMGGFCVMDDLGWDNHGPSKACEELGKLGFSMLYKVTNKPAGQDDWAVYQKVKG